LLTAIFPHTIAMLDELDNIFGGWTQFWMGSLLG
jgi:hypothetical protein